MDSAYGHQCCEFQTWESEETCHIAQVLVLIFACPWCILNYANQDEHPPLNNTNPQKLSNCNPFLFGNARKNHPKSDQKPVPFMTTISELFFHRSDLTSPFIWDLNQLAVHPATWRTCVAKTIPWSKNPWIWSFGWMTGDDFLINFETCLLFCLSGKKASGAQPLIFPEEILLWPVVTLWFRGVCFEEQFVILHFWFIFSTCHVLMRLVV